MNIRVVVFASAGLLLALTWPAQAQPSAPEFIQSWSVSSPRSLTIDSDGNVRVVLDGFSSSRIQKYSPNGVPLSSHEPSNARTILDVGSGGSLGGIVYTYQRTNGDVGVESVDPSGAQQVYLNSRRTSENNLSYVAASVGGNGIAFLAEQNLNFPFIRRLFDQFQNGLINTYQLGKDSRCRGGGNGFWADIAVGPDGTGYALWSGHLLTGVLDHVYRFAWPGQATEDGQCLGSWGSTGTGLGQLDMPSGIDVGSDGTVYVCDSGNSRIVAYDAGGAFLTAWGTPGSGNGQFTDPVSVAVSADAVYVSDRGNNRIQKFSLPTAVVPTTWSTIKVMPKG